jgi:hypothetical protein
MILTGGSSGFLLENFCPNEEEVESCSNVWVFVFFSALIISGLLLLLRRVILKPDSENKERCLG